MTAAMMRSGFLSDIAQTLIVSGDAQCRSRIRLVLSNQGFEYDVCDDPDKAVQLAAERLLELVLVDYAGHDDRALEFCRRIRRDPTTCGISIVFVGSDVPEQEIVKALWVGADEFIDLSTERSIFVARLKSLLRRHAASFAPHPADCTGRSSRAKPRRVRIGDLTIDPNRYEAYFKADRLVLSVGELRLLFALAQRPGEVVAREQLIELLHGHDSGINDRTVDSRIYSIRKRLGEAAQYIETVYGVGYRLRNA